MWRKRCSFCWRGAHDHSQCSFVSTQNKIREGLKLLPLSNVEGRIVRKDDKVPVDVEKFATDVEKRLTLLEGEVGKLKEKGLGNAGGAQKRKRDADPESPEVSKRQRKRQREKARKAEIKAAAAAKAAKGDEGKGKGAKKGSGKPAASSSK